MTDFAEQDVVITSELIKLVSGQFDVGSVLHLPLCGLGIRHLESLDGLSSLTTLDLSGNRLTKITNLAPVARCLQRLDLRHNGIVRLEGLQVLQALEVVKLQGNAVADTSTVLCLAGLPCLRAVHLQDPGGRHANPVCRAAGYKELLLKRLPRIGNLDGEYFLSEECRPRVVGDGETDDIRVGPPVRWVPEAQTTTDALVSADAFLAPSLTAARSLLDECGLVLERADKTIARQVEIRAAMN